MFVMTELHDGHCKVDANPPATIEWIKNLNTDQEEVIGESTLRMLIVNSNKNNLTIMSRHRAHYQDQHSQERKRGHLQLCGHQQRGDVHTLSTLSYCLPMFYCSVNCTAISDFFNGIISMKIFNKKCLNSTLSLLLNLKLDRTFPFLSHLGMFFAISIYVFVLFLSSVVGQQVDLYLFKYKATSFYFLFAVQIKVKVS